MQRLLFVLSLTFSLLAWAGKGPVIPAAYPGGEEAMNQYLQDSLRYPAEDRKNGREGVVFLNFVVNESGAIASTTVRGMIGGSETIKAEAIRLVLAMPSWQPATRKGKPISSTQYAMVNFELPDSLIHFAFKVDTTAEVRESMPEFMGGEPALQWFLQMAVRYPREELEKGKEGTVYVKFAIGNNGKVSDVSVVKGVPGAPGLDREAVRVVQAFPRWTPGTIEGKPVKVTMTIPVKFVLQ